MSLHEVLGRADRDTLKEIIRNAESYLAAQLTSALAANQRALTLTSVLAAATVFIAGAGGSLLLGQVPRHLFGWLCIVVAIGFLAATALAIAAAAPTDFEFSGNTPAGWREDIESGKTLEASLAEQAEHYAGMIDANNVSMKRSARLLLVALAVAWGSLLVGGFVGVMGLLALYD